MREGIMVGLIGAAVAMLLFLGVDLAAGAPLRTPAMLGNALFHGARGASEVAITTPVVLGYTAVHLAGFVLFGLAVSGLFALAEREKRGLLPGRGLRGHGLRPLAVGARRDDAVGVPGRARSGRGRGGGSPRVFPSPAAPRVPHRGRIAARTRAAGAVVAPAAVVATG
jgi:hypothetical protein